MQCLYSHTMTKREIQFNMRADAEFIEALDMLCSAEKPERKRADMLRKLVFDAQAKLKAADKKPRR